jgi:hypothetical protein
MANRWQMAKAFGRAMMEPLKAKNAGKVRDEVGDIAKKLDAGPREAYGEGITEGFNDLGKAIQFEKKRKIPELRERMDELSDEATDKSLQDAFKEGFDEAAENHGYKKWKEESKDMPLDDGFKGDLHDVNREDAVQRSREEIIKALQQNTDRDVTDVLRDFGYIFEE